MNDDLGPVRSYWPGEWFGILGDRALVVLPPSEKSRVAPLWELVDDGAGFDVTLDALISSGLRELPAFVLVSTAEGETKVVLRGRAQAVFTVAGETVELEGSSATTWVERSLHDVQRMTITVADQPDPLADVPDPAPYAVNSGLFRISRLEEAPAHEGAPEYDPGPAVVESELSDDELEIAHTEEEHGEPAPLHEEPPVRSPEPPSWTPAPAIPPIPPIPPPPTAPPVSPSPVLGDPLTEPLVLDDDSDHDGLTIMGGGPPVAEPPGIPGQPPAPDVTRAVARLVVSNGETIEVDRAIVIGRAPEARRFSATEQPHLVTVASPHLEISATHVEVRPGTGADHGSAVVTDLGSTNGTVLVQPGLGPQDLEAGVAVQLIPGAVIDLGDGVTISVTHP